MNIINFFSNIELGMNIFIYVFVGALAILAFGVTHRIRTIVVISYVIAIIDLIYFIIFYNLDMYQKVVTAKKTNNLEIYGCGYIAALIDLICIATIMGIIMIIRRFRKDQRYTL